MSTEAITVGLAQRIPVQAEHGLQPFREDVRDTMRVHPHLNLLVYPEMHLHGVLHLPQDEQLRALQYRAVTLDSSEIQELGGIAAEHGIWLCPGSIEEVTAEGTYHNTQLLFSPEGKLVSHYRKMFPWRPDEHETPGTEFVVSKLTGTSATVGLSNCYDAWFPEHSRHLTWLGADMILNVVKTTSKDREQELTIAKANAIVNQVYMLSVNCAEPYGRGRSIAVDPEGYVLAEAGLEDTTLVVEVDTTRVHRVREQGTAGTNRMWHQFSESDRSIPLSMYGGEIDPKGWTPRS